MIGFFSTACKNSKFWVDLSVLSQQFLYSLQNNRTILSYKELVVEFLIVPQQFCPSLSQSSSTIRLCIQISNLWFDKHSKMIISPMFQFSVLYSPEGLRNFFFSVALAGSFALVVQHKLCPKMLFFPQEWDILDTCAKSTNKTPGDRR